MRARLRSVGVGIMFVVGALSPRIALAQQPPPLPPPPPEAPAAPSAAAVPQPTPPPSAVPAPSGEEMRHRRLAVDIDSTRPSTVIERRVSVTEGEGQYFFVPSRSTEAIWEQVCVTPCQVHLDRFSTYRVAAMNKVSGSRKFTLPQGTDALHLKIDSGDLLGHRIGGALTGAGLVATIVGASLVAGASAFKDETQVRTAGFITGGAGLIVMAVGIPIAIATATHIVSDGGSQIALTPHGVTF